MKTSLVYFAALFLSAIAVPVDPEGRSCTQAGTQTSAQAGAQAGSQEVPKKDPKKAPKQDPKKAPKPNPKQAPKPAPKKGKPAPKAAPAPKPPAAAPNATAALPPQADTCVGMSKSCSHVLKELKEGLDNGTIDIKTIDEFAAKLERDPKCADAVRDCGGQLPSGIVPPPAQAPAKAPAKGAPKGSPAKAPAGKPAGPGGASAPKKA
ncbi:cytochrome d ubiquinol oxidase subunit [Purpureocillium lavendulum]|uniref:Cytochrome d ubiquinol oxidase subunit n=1 Tax=Purpureocillium lavendulum TaxID=1247861 RepID=A0AB34FDG8_9HYPO|nr:cytochrome d ubiquinol oxidase subunit [Purpureocillium lavendulum]